MAHDADFILSVKPLETGYSKDYDGKVIIINFLFFEFQYIS